METKMNTEVSDFNTDVITANILEKTDKDKKTEDCSEQKKLKAEEISEAKTIDIVARRILETYRTAFEELAK